MPILKVAKMLIMNTLENSPINIATQYGNFFPHARRLD